MQYAYEYWKHNFENRHYGSFLENELMEHRVLYEDDLRRIYTFQEKRVLLNEVLLEYSLDLGPEICKEINNYCNYLNFSYQSDTCGLYNLYDKNAVQVYDQREKLIGYVPRYYAEAFAAFIKEKRVKKGKILCVDKNRNCDECIKIEVSVAGV